MPASQQRPDATPARTRWHCTHSPERARRCKTPRTRDGGRVPWPWPSSLARANTCRARKAKGERFDASLLHRSLSTSGPRSCAPMTARTTAALGRRRVWTANKNLTAEAYICVYRRSSHTGTASMDKVFETTRHSMLIRPSLPISLTDTTTATEVTQQH